MRIARFSTVEAAGTPRFGVVEGDGDDAVIAAVEGHPFGAVAFTGERYAVRAVRLLSPVLPSKVVAIGKNYPDHAREMGGEAPASPVLFLKPSTSVTGHEAVIACPPSVTRLDYEGELAVVIGRLARDVPRERAMDVVLGLTCANDVTARDQQSADGQWARAKGYDTFCPLGPWIETELDPADLAITTRLDGRVCQQGRTSELVHDVATLVSFVSEVMTLLPGDVLLTGTPAGVGPMTTDQVVEVEVEGIGVLRNSVGTR